ncbi:hypothetical protein Bca52824_065448 [Brassica carinata]|uniref:Uncharacterized protein n=1 Tax=Brassica carinata TaxID=52824 RepID=A0A8X7QJE9_BRACI|nr:hypothetical protein Bca52824_065448 [Brassica carinata]
MVDILEDLTGETQTNSVYSNKEWIVADWGCAWPETDNIWELLENLQSISASIDAFEKCNLRPGKAVKKRKGQYGGCNSQLNKKKNQQGLTSTSDDASEKTDPTLNERFMKEVLKSGIVKRYIPDETTSNNQITKAADQNGTPDLDIVRIIKAVVGGGRDWGSTYITNNGQDSLVTFSSLRSDGEEVTVDNKFLRAHKVITIIC